MLASQAQNPNSVADNTGYTLRPFKRGFTGHAWRAAKTLTQLFAAILLMLFILVLLTLISPSILSAQNESGKRPLSKDRFIDPDYWYSDANAMYQVQYPIIRSLPPLNSGMPYNIMLSYIYLDSLLRFDRNDDTKRMFERWHQESKPILNDTLKWAASYLYQMMDYNPIIFNQYASEVGLKGKKYGPSLFWLIADIKSTMRDFVHAYGPNPNHAAAVYSALSADYILRVKVNAIDSMERKPASSNPETKMRYRVTASVLDTLKGQVFKKCSSDNLYQVKGGIEEGRTLLSGSTSCIQFQYNRGNYSDGWVSGRWLTYDRDPAFIANETGGFGMQVGQEAIVFLTHTNDKVDSTHDYYDIFLHPGASYNALPILNGLVRDVNRVWSSNELIPYDQWKLYYTAIKDKIISTNY